MNFKICFTRIQNGRRKQVLMIIKVKKKFTSAGENINFEKYIDMGSVVNGIKIRIYKKKLKNDRVRAKKTHYSTQLNL